MRKLFGISFFVVASCAIVETSNASEEESFGAALWRTLTTTTVPSSSGYSDGSLPGESLSDTARRKADEQDWPYKHDNWGNRVGN